MKEMQNWLKENLTEVWVEEVWLPSSPDCKPFDYFVCGVSELRVKAKSRNKSKDLILKMKEVMGSLARDTLAMACTSFRSRIEALFKADGSFIEYIDCQYVSLLTVFYFNKIGLFSAVLCHLKERRKKSPDLSLPPCIMK
jgi:hypothetical protein